MKEKIRRKIAYLNLKTSDEALLKRLLSIYLDGTLIINSMLKL
ncbi:16540_t:CDS:2 [Dentiscutata erythropus]|uniref:16540_t:CDS:1 n=1 Tax=Dentiscutata erythropus TaxID=1348616 RepID=A0A9N9BE91_9GLOM|nr:16540_t:CDS:2 [Dentiscutata erythropus]